MPRVLFIDDDFSPKVSSGTEDLARLVGELESAGYRIGPSEFDGCMQCPAPPGNAKPVVKDGMSVYNAAKNINGRKLFKSLSDSPATSDYGSMFFKVDAAFAYFEKFVTEEDRWSEIDVIIIDIMMPPGANLHKKYRHEKTDIKNDNAGIYLMRHLCELVEDQIFNRNPGTILPVMLLTQREGAEPNGLLHRPQSGEKNRLLVWGMTKEYALDKANEGAFVGRLNWLVDGRKK